jgi:glucose/arabinose dehydrogenase
LSQRWFVAAALTLGLIGFAGTEGESFSGIPLTQDPSADIVTRAEYVEWDQMAAGADEVARLHFVARIDGVRVSLIVSCDTTPTPAGFRCSSPLPPLMPGRHTLDLTAVALDGDVAVESGISHLEIFRIGDPLIARAALVPTVERPRASIALRFNTQDGAHLAVETHVTHLNGPVVVTFAPDGLLFVIEQSRQIRVIGHQGISDAAPALTLSQALEQGEIGRLVDIVVHPDFARNRQVYVLCAAQEPGLTPSYRLERFRELNGVLAERVVVLDGIPASSAQRGGLVRFGPDRRLYLGLEDLDTGSVAQDLGSLNGKILRLNEDGTVPRDNPLASPVFSRGHAIPVGLAWHPQTGDMWEVERSLDGEDELNLVTANADYGWPDPRLASRPATQARIALGSSLEPAGATFNTGALIPEFRGDLFLVSRSRNSLYRVRFDSANPRHVIAIEPLLENLVGHLSGVTSGPDGAVYVITSNEDATTDAQPGDYRILRIVPAS